MKTDQLQELLTEYRRRKILSDVYSESNRAELVSLREKIVALQNKLSN